MSNPQGQGGADQHQQELPIPTPAKVLQTETQQARALAHEHTHPARSSHASELQHLPEAPAVLELVRQNLQLQSQQIRQLAEMLQRDREETADLLQEMRATMELVQQMIGQWADQMEKLGLAVAALVRLHQAMEERDRRQQEAQQQEL